LIALSNVAEQFMNDLLGVFGLELTSIQLFSISSWPKPLALLTFFCGKRFLAVECTSLIAYCAFYGKFIKHIIVSKKWVAAHFRYNWMEPIVYKSILYIPIILVGVNLEDVLLFISFQSP
jgi:hypothetical protein